MDANPSPRMTWSPFQPRLRSRVALGLFMAFLGLWVWAAIGPVHRFNWFIENLLVFLTVPLLVFLWRRRPISDATWFLVAAFYALHVIGSHWSYSNVPLPWKSWGFERNHYDRVVHFAYGLLLVGPLREMLGWRRGVDGVWAWLLALQVVTATGALYEIIEWGAAVILAPEDSAQFLGAQGDEFDAVKDIALAVLGALIVALAAIALPENRRSSQP